MSSPSSEAGAGPRRARQIRTALLWVAGLGALGATIVVAARRVDTAALAQGWQAIRSRPLTLAGVFGAYGLAFAIRAAVWRRTVPALTFGMPWPGST